MDQPYGFVVRIDSHPIDLLLHSLKRSRRWTERIDVRTEVQHFAVVQVVLARKGQGAAAVCQISHNATTRYEHAATRYNRRRTCENLFHWRSSSGSPRKGF